MWNMRPTNRLEREGGNRAVSPVIGVILMVAITVILAAVIGAFVLEIGDNQETAPSTSFDTDEAVTFYADENNNVNVNLTDLKITHAGGETIDVDNTEIAVDGNDVVWGPTSRPPSYRSDGLIEVTPQPNACRLSGTNEKALVSSGESWIVALVEKPTGEGMDTNDWTGDGKIKWRHTGGEPGSFGSPDTMECKTPFGYSPKYRNIKILNNNGWQIADGDGGDYLRSGDDVTVVWEASSGGKTQTLQRYTIQTTSPAVA